MGDVSDWAKNQGLLTGTANDVAADIEGVLNIISAVGTGVGAATLVLQVFGVLSSDNTAKKIDELIKDFDELWKLLEGIYVIGSMRDVQNNGITPAETEAQTLYDFHDGNHLIEYTDPNSHMWLDSLSAVNNLRSEPYWVRPLFPEGVYNDVFSGSLAPPDAAGPGSAVFDYRLTLSAYLYAIVVRLTILFALAEVDPRFRDIAKTEASSYASEYDLDGKPGLLHRYAQMWAGIARIRALTFQELKEVGLPASASMFWELANRPYGAVDTYSTVAVIGQFPPDQIPNLNTNAFPEVLQAWYEKFLFRHSMGTLARWKRVYQLMGLAHVKNIINALKAIAGESPVPPTRPDTGDWSLLEAEQATPESIYPRHGALVLQLSVRDWLIKSFDGSVLTGAPILGKTSISVRRTLENFAGLQ